MSKWDKLRYLREDKGLIFWAKEEKMKWNQKRLDPYREERPADLSPSSHILPYLNCLLFYLWATCSQWKKMISLLIKIKNWWKEWTAIYNLFWTCQGNTVSWCLTGVPFIVAYSRCVGQLCVCYSWPRCSSIGQLVHKMAECKSPAGRVWQGHSKVSPTMRN